MSFSPLLSHQLWVSAAPPVARAILGTPLMPGSSLICRFYYTQLVVLMTLRVFRAISKVGEPKHKLHFYTFSEFENQAFLTIGVCLSHKTSINHILCCCKMIKSEKGQYKLGVGDKPVFQVIRFVTAHEQGISRKHQSITSNYNKNHVFPFNLFFCPILV